jgi:1-phosphofructokinase
VIITLTPNPSIDRTLEVPALALGQVHRATRQHQEPSGKGVNVTRALTANGVASLAVLPCGGPEGSELAALLNDEQVTFQTVRIAGSVRVNVSLTEPGGRVTKVNTPGPVLTPGDLERLTETALAAAGPQDWIVCSGSLPPGAPFGYYAQVCERVHRAGLRFALDTSGEALVSGLAAAPDVVKPNVEELAETTGKQIRTLHDAIIGAKELLGRGAGSVVASLGADGALLVTEDATWHARAAAPAVRSTVGAGDALLAGFLAAGGAGVSALREALVWATAAIGVEGSHVPFIGDTTRTAIRVTVEPGTELPLGHRLLAPVNLPGGGWPGVTRATRPCYRPGPPAAS